MTTSAQSLLFAALLAMGAGLAPASEEAPRMLCHDVYFTLQQDTPKTREALVAGCRKFLSKHPGIVWFAAGSLVEEHRRDVNDRDFDVALHIVFQDKASHDKYQKADAHQKFIQEFSAGWKSVRVFDSWLTATAHGEEPAGDGRPARPTEGEGRKLFTFLLTTVGISLSGVLAPGPMTAATLAAGVRSPHAGLMIALGHALIEGPLMLLILAGAGAAFEVPSVKLGIGLAGGAFLLFLGGQLLAALRKGQAYEEASETRHPLVTGVVLTAANPYFLIWWATVGMALAADAVKLGVLAFALFGALHWLCDLVWLEILSLASYKGTEVLGGRMQQAVLLVCGIMLVGFGAMFLKDACLGLMSR